jgi:hypothetical protein
MANENILSGGIVPPAVALTNAEMASFNEGFNAVTALYDEYGPDSLSYILRSEKPTYVLGAEYAKAAFGQNFGGIVGSSGINMQLIRSATVLSQGSSTPVYTWSKNITTTGWGSLFGSKTTQFTLKNSQGGNTVVNTYKNVMFVATHIIDSVKPLYDEIQIGANSTDYPIYPVTTQKIGGRYVIKLPMPLVILNDTQFYVMANYQRLGTASPQLLGFQYALHTYATLQ